MVVWLERVSVDEVQQLKPPHGGLQLCRLRVSRAGELAGSERSMSIETTGVLLEGR